VHDPPIQSEAVEIGHGACDALLLGVVGLTEDGDSQTTFHTINGVTGKALDPGEQFKIWYLLARDLAQLLEPGTGRQEMCEMVAGKIAECYQQAREAASESSTSKSN
jgi:hypothetical protein